MKRSIAAVVCLLGLAIAASICSADQVDYHWATFPLSFRTQATAATIGNSNSHLIPTVAAGGVISYGTAAYMDSVSFQHVGQGNAVAETTIAFPTSLIRSNSWQLADTTNSLVVYLRDTGANCAGCSGTGTIDSLYCNVQVSDDGNNWLSIAETLLPMANAATTNAKTFHRKFSGNCLGVNGTLSIGTSVPTIGCFKYVRWIFYDDGSNATAIHNFFGEVRYQSANTQDNR